ncbi:unnamed protein product [Plutella xylostella]|uniref:(diamondback moth) hypothetical protein n=1 Tax=Plutella xylostella TaxID=51655 RepID=A0A8S4EL25_PLUXY|nr:unnamed protein product [Plutella xylostella]
MLLGLPRYCGASGMFAEAHTDGFHAIMRKRVASLMRRVRQHQQPPDHYSRESRQSAATILDVCTRTYYPGYTRGITRVRHSFLSSPIVQASDQLSPCAVSYTPRRVGRTANLTLHVDTHTAGRYVCQATVEGYPPIEAEANVFIKGT